MKSFELHVARALPRCACHWLNLGTLLCLSWAIAVAAPAVELLRDSWGTPHIFATTETDGFFGLGYAAAEDRLLQQTQLYPSTIAPEKLWGKGGDC